MFLNNTRNRVLVEQRKQPSISSTQKQTHIPHNLFIHFKKANKSLTRKVLYNFLVGMVHHKIN